MEETATKEINVVRGELADAVAGAHEVLLSVASVWELAIKAGLGRLGFVMPVEQFVKDHLQLNRILLLPIAVDHAAHVASLPHYHRDLFDRMLVVQAQLEICRSLVPTPRWIGMASAASGRVADVAARGFCVRAVGIRAPTGVQ